MKEAVGTARNLYLSVSEDKGTVVPMIETILIVSEPKFRISKEGLVRVRKSGTLRFHSNPETLRAIAAQLVNAADEADELLKKATTQPT